MTQMVFIHGSGHTHESFAAQVVAFPGCDAISLPGHPEGAALTSVGDCATWLAKYLRWKGLERAIVGGNSLGGAIAIEWALRYPESAAGLVLLGTGGRLRVSSEIFEMIDGNWPACIDTLVDWSLAPAAPDSIRVRMKEWHHSVGQASTRTDYAVCNAFDATDRIRSIKAPTLIIVGTADEMTPVKYSRFLNHAIQASELSIIEGAGHLAHAEKPDIVNDLIRVKFAEAIA